MRGAALESERVEMGSGRFCERMLIVLADIEVSNVKLELCGCKKTLINKAAIFTKKKVISINQLNYTAD
jgi:hypothetical protein